MLNSEHLKNNRSKTLLSETPLGFLAMNVNPEITRVATFAANGLQTFKDRESIRH